jgi:hypothetical protein
VWVSPAVAKTTYSVEHGALGFETIKCGPGGVSVVGIVTRLRVETSGIRNPTDSRGLAVFLNFQTGSGSHLSYSAGTGVLSRGLNRSSPSRIEAENAWRCTPTSPTCLRVVDKASFILGGGVICVCVCRYVCVRTPCGCCDIASDLSSGSTVRESWLCSCVCDRFYENFQSR